MTFLDELRAKAVLWRDRPPSGRFVLHGVPRTRWCRLHGLTTKYHMCKVTHPEICGGVAVARSAWMETPDA